MLSQQTNKILGIIYLIFLITAGGFVYYTINNPTVDAEEREEKKKTERVKPVDVYLKVDDKRNPKTYKLKMENVNSVLDIIERAHDDYGLVFEKYSYTYGTEIDLVNGIKSPEGYIWKIYEDEKDITFNIQDVRLNDEQTYSIVLEKEK